MHTTYLDNVKNQIHNHRALKDLQPDDTNILMSSLDSILQTAYKSIDELYGKYHPDMYRDDQIAIYKEMIAIKVELKALQLEHMELTKILNGSHAVYLANEFDVHIPDKYILTNLKMILQLTLWKRIIINC